jgi:FkbM family methyltransferase
VKLPSRRSPEPVPPSADAASEDADRRAEKEARRAEKLERQREKLESQGARLEARAERAEAEIAAAEAEFEETRSRLERLKAELRDLTHDRQAARGGFITAAAEFTPDMVADAEGSRWLVSTTDSNIGRALFVKNDRKELRVIPRVLDALATVGVAPRRELLLDVGANIGTTSVDAVRRLGFARAVALEPEPENHLLLRLNAVLNGVDDRIEIHQVAVSDAEGVAPMDVGNTNSGAYTLVGSEGGGAATIEVPTVTLDGLADRGAFDPADVSLVWMDIEGFEVHALLGARGLLERGVPVVLELNPKLLRRAGRADDLAPLLAAHYTHVAEVGTLGDDDATAFAPVDALHALMERTAERHTDVVVCRRG